MHFEVVASPAELARGIRSTTTTPTPQPPNSEDLDMDEQRLREIVREETERGSNRTISFVGAMLEAQFPKIAKWTKAMSDLTVGRIKSGK
jgi:hypothetical protein